jgi:cell division protein FtsQ
MQGELDMAGDYIYSDDAVQAVPVRFEKKFKAIIALAVLCLAGELVWLVGITPFRPFSRIDISGYDGIGRVEILDRAGINKESSYFSVNTMAVERALEGIGSLESARVFKHFPDKLQILLEGRQAVASALANVDGRIVPVLFDSQGVIFEIGGNKRNSTLYGTQPVISGFVIENPFPGMRLPAVFISVFKELEKIEIRAPELLAAVSELQINRKPFEGFDLVLYPMHKKVKVRLSELNEDFLRYTLLMVDVLAAKEPEIDSLDFRAGIVSYIPKEAFSE